MKANYLASPPLVVAYALAGRIDIDLEHEPLGTAPDGRDVFLRDLWPSSEEIQRHDRLVGAGRDVHAAPTPTSSAATSRGGSLETPSGDRYAWDPASTYVRQPPYFDGLELEPAPVADIQGARCLVSLGDSVTTDHISPAGRSGSTRRQAAT